MRTYKAVFSDIDGTLLTSEHIVSTATIEAIASLQKKNIPFVIISSRSASCIYPILKKHHFQCPIVACGGAWIEDMNFGWVKILAFLLNYHWSYMYIL